MRKLYTIAILILISCTSQSLYAQQADHQKLLELVRTHAIRLGLTTEDASAAVISSSYSDIHAASIHISRCITIYNYRRRHSSLNWQLPAA